MAQAVAAFTILYLVVGSLAQAAAPTTRPAEPFVLAGMVEGACTTDHTPFSRDGSRFSTETANEAVRIWAWDGRTLKPLTEPLPHPGLQFHRLSGDGKTVMTAGGHGVRLWEVATSELKSGAKVSDKEVFSFADLSPDGKRFVTVDEDDIFTLSVWEAGADRPAFKLRRQGVVQSAEFDPTGKLIVTHELGVGFRVWAADTGREARPLIESNDDFFAPCQAQFDPTGERLVAPGKEGFVVVESSADKTIVDAKFKAKYTRGVRFIAGGAKVAVSFW